MLRLLLAFLNPAVPVQAVELLRDLHGSEEYVFEADQAELTATVDAAGATCPEDILATGSQQIGQLID
jgi:hypothetical protein